MLPELPPFADGQLVVAVHSHEVPALEVLEEAAKGLMPAVVLSGRDLLRLAPRPVSQADAAGWLARLLPNLVQSYRAQGIRTLLLAYPFVRAQSVAAVRAAVATWLPHGQVWRLTLDESEVRRRLQGPDAERRCMAWQQLHRAQEAEARSGDFGEELVLGGDPATDAAPIVARMTQPVLVVEPDPGWPGAYEAAQRELALGLGGHAKEIHHIGSTSVPGLPAKPIIDIMITVEELAPVRTWIPDLRALGYRFVDHPQNTDRLVFVRTAAPAVNLHFVADDSGELARHLRFRDRLRADEELRARYAELKRGLASAYPEQRWLYTESKSAFIRAAEA